MDELIEIKDVSKTYDMGAEAQVRALDSVSISIRPGEYVAIMGPSGSGKSTLMNLIGCLDTPSAGSYKLKGREIASMSDDELAHIRNREIGFIFQTFNLLPVLSAEENVEYPLLRFREIPATERRERVAKYLELVRLTPHAKHRPNQLSGGQRQRVAIARALATHPRMILADEPTANLDHRTGSRILRLMRKINRDHGTTFIFSTHDQRVLDIADRRVDIEDGRIVRLGVRVGEDWTYANERMAAVADSSLTLP